MLRKIIRIKRVGRIKSNSLGKFSGKGTGNEFYVKNQEIITSERGMEDKEVRDKVEKLTDNDFVRKGTRKERQRIQREKLNIPLLATTTIGSFPQTKEVKLNRSKFRKNEINKEEYDKNVF